jgi:hypothetical protein
MLKEKPALMSIIKSDRWANLTMRIPLIFITVLFIMALVESFSGNAYSYFSTEPGSVPSLVYFTAASIILSIPLLLWRYKYFIRLFNTGESVEGIVTSVYFRGRNGFVEYSFNHMDKETRYFNSVFRNSRAMSMKEGDSVTILIMDGNPEKSHIKELLV